MTDTKCPRCGATMEHVALNYLGFDDNGHHYECPNCEYSEYVKPKHPSAGFDEHGYLKPEDDADEYENPYDLQIPHIYGGTIVGVSYEGDETIVRVKLDHPDEPIHKAHVCIIDAEQVFV